MLDGSVPEVVVGDWREPVMEGSGAG